MMNESMDSMMGGVMGLAWLPTLLALVLLIGGVVLLFRLFSPTGGDDADALRDDGHDEVMPLGARSATAR